MFINDTPRTRQAQHQAGKWNMLGGHSSYLVVVLARFHTMTSPSQSEEANRFSHGSTPLQRQAQHGPGACSHTDAWGEWSHKNTRWSLHGQRRWTPLSAARAEDRRKRGCCGRVGAAAASISETSSLRFAEPPWRTEAAHPAWPPTTRARLPTARTSGTGWWWWPICAAGLSSWTDAHSAWRSSRDASWWWRCAQCPVHRLQTEGDLNGPHPALSRCCPAPACEWRAPCWSWTPWSPCSRSLQAECCCSQDGIEYKAGEQFRKSPEGTLLSSHPTRGRSYPGRKNSNTGCWMTSPGLSPPLYALSFGEGFVAHCTGLSDRWKHRMPKARNSCARISQCSRRLCIRRKCNACPRRSTRAR